jgi:hypothetical protein
LFDVSSVRVFVLCRFLVSDFECDLDEVESGDGEEIFGAVNVDDFDEFD